jgi:hypothetical protein
VSFVILISRTSVTDADFVHTHHELTVGRRVPAAPLVAGWDRCHRESRSSCTATSTVTRRLKARSDAGAWNALPDSGTDPGSGRKSTEPLDVMLSDAGIEVVKALPDSGQEGQGGAAGT